MSTALTATGLHRALYWLVGQLAFSRIRLRNHAALSTEGPVLYLGLHRNGAVDGIPYLKAVPDAAYLVSAQLHRSALGRLVFPGIAVARAKDRRRGIRADNADGIARCVTHLVNGGKLFVMPEGTSSLGPRHLPFQPGAARIAQQVLARGSSLTIVPLAIHYECAWEWQCRVEVVAGAPFVLSPGQQAGVDQLQDRFASALERVGVNVGSTDELRFIEMLASMATLGTGRSYADSLKQFENGVPDELRQLAGQLHAAAAQARLLTHQGVPIMPAGSLWAQAGTWLVLAPLVLLSVAANLPPILAAHAAGKRLADDVNVVAFWRIVVGLPALLLWLAVLLPLLWIAGGPWLLAAYAGISVLGLKLLHRVRQLTVAVCNGIRAPSMKAPLRAFRSSLLKSLGHG